MKISTTLTILAAVTYGSAQTNINPQDALRLAAKNRRSLQAAKLFLDESRAKSRALGAYASTVIGIGASTRSDVGATDGDLYLSQPIDLFGKRDANQRIGNAGVQLALATYFAVARDLQTEVLTAFAETSTARARSEVAGELLNVAERLFAATKRRFDEGNVAETQVTRASIELARAKQAKDLFASQYIRSLTRLASLLGTESNEITVEPDSDIRPPDAATFESRPDLLTLNA